MSWQVRSVQLIWIDLRKFRDYMLHYAAWLWTLNVSLMSVEFELVMISAHAISWTLLQSLCYLKEICLLMCTVVAVQDSYSAQPILILILDYSAPPDSECFCRGERSECNCS